MVEEMPYFFLGKYLYKVDIVWCDVIIGTCSYIVCVYVHTHICDMYVYTHTPLSMTYKIMYQIGNFKILCILCFC